MIRRPPRSTQSRSSAASDVYKRQFWSRPNVSCLTWREYNGTWKRENDTIIFFDQYDVMENDVKFTFQNNPNNEKFKIYFATDKNSELKKTEIKIQFVYDYDADL